MDFNRRNRCALLSPGASPPSIRCTTRRAEPSRVAPRRAASLRMLDFENADPFAHHSSFNRSSYRNRGETRDSRAETAFSNSPSTTMIKLPRTERLTTRYIDPVASHRCPTGRCVEEIYGIVNSGNVRENFPVRVLRVFRTKNRPHSSTVRYRSVHRPRSNLD